MSVRREHAAANQSALPQRRRRQFPRILLAITQEDERRKTTLLLTKERFVVDVCATGADVVPMWTHPLKYDAVITFFDEVADPTCPLVVATIRRKEIENETFQAAEVEGLQMIRLGEGAAEKITSHRAQRFAERKNMKSELMALQKGTIGGNSVSLVPVAGSTGVFRSALTHRKTVIFGFCHPQRPEARATMEHHGHYDRVFNGRPSDEANIATFVELLRAEYTIPVPTTVPTFAELIKTLVDFRASTSTLDSPKSPTSPSNGGDKMAKWRGALDGLGKTSPQGAQSSLISLERKNREAAERITDLTAARDAAEADLQTTNLTNQKHRAWVAAGEVAVWPFRPLRPMPSPSSSMTRPPSSELPPPDDDSLSSSSPSFTLATSIKDTPPASAPPMTRIDELDAWKMSVATGSAMRNRDGWRPR